VEGGKKCVDSASMFVISFVLQEAAHAEFSVEPSLAAGCGDDKDPLSEKLPG
jgi:hypothetical protein